MDTRTRLTAALDGMPEFIVGGELCLDFANTVEPRGGFDLDAERAGTERPHRDYLGSYVDLIAWMHRVSGLSEQAAIRLIDRANHHPRLAASSFARAIAVREAIYRVFLAISLDEEPSREDVSGIEAAYQGTLAHAHLARTGTTFAWEWESSHGDPAIDLASPLWLIARSAVDLLTSVDPRRIKTCPGVPGAPYACSWLFHDTSKSRTRRWCTMADCGGHTKAQRLTARRRSAQSS